MVWGWFLVVFLRQLAKLNTKKVWWLRKIAKKSICEEIFAKFNLNIKFSFAMYPFGYSTDVVMGVCWLLVSFVRLTGLTNQKQECFQISFFLLYPGCLDMVIRGGAFFLTDYYYFFANICILFAICFWTALNFKVH